MITRVRGLRERGRKRNFLGDDHADELRADARCLRCPGDTTIDAVAAEYVSANDITLDLYSPTGRLLVHGDTLTSPESVHYATDNLPAGTYHLQVCPFQGGVVTTPYDYTGAYSVTNGPAVGIPGSDVGGEVGPPTITGRPASSASAPRRSSTPSGPRASLSTSSTRAATSGSRAPGGQRRQNSFIHRSTDGGLGVPHRQPERPAARPGPGGGDTDIVTDDQGYVYFVDLESLVNLGTSVSNDKRQQLAEEPGRRQNTRGRPAVVRDRQRHDGVGRRQHWSSSASTRPGSARSSTPVPGSTGPTDAGWGARLAERGRERATAARQRRHLRAAPLRPGQPEPLLRLQRGQPRSRHDRTRRARPADGDQVPQRRVPASRRAAAVQGHLFPALAVDKGGNVYAAWIDTNDSNVYYSSSRDQGTTWTSRRCR